MNEQNSSTVGGLAEALKDKTAQEIAAAKKWTPEQIAAIQSLSDKDLETYQQLNSEQREFLDRYAENRASDAVTEKRSSSIAKRNERWYFYGCTIGYFALSILGIGLTNAGGWWEQNSIVIWSLGMPSIILFVVVFLDTVMNSYDLFEILRDRYCAIAFVCCLFFASGIGAIVAGGSVTIGSGSAGYPKSPVSGQVVELTDEQFDSLTGSGNDSPGTADPSDTTAQGQSGEPEG